MNTQSTFELLLWILAIIHLTSVAVQCWAIHKSHTSDQIIQPAYPSFTVIVCAHNELKNLQVLIPALLQQDYPAYQIIVVLDRCTDGSQSFLNTLENEAVQYLIIDQVPGDIHPKKYGLTRAIEMASTDWLLFTDADCVPSSNAWIRTFSKHADKNTEVILGIGAYKNPGGPFAHITIYETLCTALSYIAAALNRYPYMGVGRNLAYRKGTFFRNGGFQCFAQVTGGDDDLLVQQMATNNNTRVNMDKKGLTYSHPERTFNAYLGQKTRHLSVGRYYPLRLQVSHTVRMTLHALLWVGLFIGMIFLPSVRIIGLFSLFVIIKGIIFNNIASWFGMAIPTIWYPLLDMVYALGLPLIGLRANVMKRIKWKN